jgi:tol-pal system protein YbgF
MLSFSIRALLCGVAVAALAGCTSGRSAQTPQDAPAAKVTLADMKNTQDTQTQEIARLAGDVKAMDAQQAFLVAEIKTLSDQIAKLKSSLTEAEGAMRSLRATPAPPESRPVFPFVPPSVPAVAPVPIPAPAPRPTAPADSAPSAPAAVPAAPPSRDTEADRVFAAALAKLRGGDDGQAALEFTDFVVQYPAHPQAAAAQNHIGEAYFRQRDYRQAMAEFQKTVDGYMQAAQVSEALLKIGLCQRELGDAARAKASWEQVVKQFPKSDAARQARTLLASRAAAPR